MWWRKHSNLVFINIQSSTVTQSELQQGVSNCVTYGLWILHLFDLLFCSQTVPAARVRDLIQTVHALHSQKVCMLSPEHRTHSEAHVCSNSDLTFTIHYTSRFLSGTPLLYMWYTLLKIYIISDYSLFQSILDQKTHMDTTGKSGLSWGLQSYMTRKQMLHSLDANGLTHSRLRHF